jgi:hypothetical protein
MPLKMALDIVLDLAEANVIEDQDYVEERKRQLDAIERVREHAKDQAE